jgi:hypothetical protein
VTQPKLHKTSILVDDRNGDVVRKSQNFSHVWWCTPIIPAVGRVRQENSEFEASMGNSEF